MKYSCKLIEQKLRQIKRLNKPKTLVESLFYTAYLLRFHFTCLYKKRQ